ncbi:MAG: FAD-binding oxidoreductase [Alphaproteobacteria bacterium]|nr:FAD-binding oxidoreductase [Alphaproteobacteria bacterium]
MAERTAVVIGGGISGVLVARELLRDGWAVTLLEGMHIGAGSSSRTAAGIRQQFSTVATVRGMRHAVDFYKAFAEESGCKVIEQVGYLFLHADVAAWDAAQERAAVQRDAGLHDVEVLDHDAVVAAFPWVEPHQVLGGTWCPSDGFLHPEVVYQEGARRVRELGGRLVQHAQVDGATRDGDRLVTVHAGGRSYAGDLFLDCTNAWSGRLATALGAEVLPIDPIKRYLWFVRRAGGMTGEALMHMPMVISPSGVYGRPENPDTLLMGWAHGGTPQPAFQPEDQDTIEPTYAHDGGIDAVPFEAWSHMAEVVPLIGEFDGVVATTSGFYGVTPDHNPFLAYDRQLSNLVRLAGFSGHGAMFGPFTAAVARALADAGRDLPSVTLPVGEVSLAEFAIGRSFGHAEVMVI